MEKKFKPEKFSAYTKYTNELNELIEKGQFGNDYIRNELTATMDNFIFTHMQSKQTLSKTFDRPTFFDWLLRRKKFVRFEVEISEMLPNPPKIDDLIYKTKVL